MLPVSRSLQSTSNPWLFRFIAVAVVVGLAAFSLVPKSWAQVLYGTLTGTVIDASGAPVPSARIEAVNVNFARVETIKKFMLIERQLTPEDEELTPTMKLKRNFVNKRYAGEIDAMYRERAVA